MRPARAGSCCATPMAARCRTRCGQSSRRWRAMCRAIISASTPMMIAAAPSQQSLAAVEAGVRQHPGHAQRARRALRQRQSGDADRHAGAQAPLCRALRHRHPRGETGPAHPRLAQDRRVAQPLAETGHAPFVGASAFATKAGIHASAVLKDPRTYEHVTPESVGNVGRFWCRIRPENPISSQSWSGLASRSTRRSAADARARGDQAEGVGRLRLRGRRLPRSICWPGVPWARCRPSSRSSASRSMSSAATMRSASWSPSRRPS